MTTILIFLLLLSILVLVHEFGHYAVARVFGVKAEEFGWGFPPRAIGWTRGKKTWLRIHGKDIGAHPRTVWSINWLPLGGFVKLKGEQGEGGQEPDSFMAKPAWQRFLIIAAGVLMNWLLAAGIFSIGFLIGVPAQLDTVPKGAVIRDPQVRIMEILPNSPASQAGLLPGDQILSVGPLPVTMADETRKFLNVQSDRQTPFLIRVKQQDVVREFTVQPTYIETLQRPGIGIALANTAIVQFPWYRALIQGQLMAWSYAKMILNGLYTIAHDLVNGKSISAPVSGPIGIAVMTKQISEQGLWSLAQFAAILSINLALINFFPIPALDGGRAAFILIEWIRRKRVDPQFESRLHQYGFCALLGLIVLVTIGDLRRYGMDMWQGFLNILK